ncbi:hypothetical protein J4733_17970 [Klebsiella pneumoniae]|uniref:Uncharacterized protein n=1 Tax=Klebsiella pneumoniae TaxID=573 RepID=A0A939NTY6_KLEPN|nr:hypothetical protein [Klebsiella pneumoniae]
MNIEFECLASSRPYVTRGHQCWRAAQSSSVRWTSFLISLIAASRAST